MNTLLRSEKAASTVIGHIIVLGLTITGVAMITLLGTPMIKSMQNMDNIKNTEQTFSILDSRASKTILGDSPVEQVDINLGEGTLAIEPNSTDRKSYIVVNSSNFSLTIPMGKVVYRLGDREVAYEEGGIFSKYPSGGSVMLSPPELHYNGVTLTLPGINIGGNGSAGGRGRADISFRNKGSSVLYPDSSNNMSNPLDYNIHGKVFVHITSDFYDAWAEYARSLIYTNVSTDPSNRRADIELTVVPSNFGRDRPIYNPIVLRGIPDGGEPLDNFSFKVQPGSNNLMWDIRLMTENKRLIIYFKDVNDWVAGKKVDMSIGYQEDGKGYDKPAEIWAGEKVFTIQSDNFTNIDLLNKSINLTYSTSETVGSVNSEKCQPFGGKIVAGDSNDTGGFSWSEEYHPGDNNSIYNIVQHYVSKVAEGGEDLSFYRCTPSDSDKKGPDADSTMLVNYKPKGALTYLLISKADTEVTIK